MFIDFLFELRRRGLKVSSHEWNSLMEGVAAGLHGSSLDGFYRLARSICVKDVSEYDAYDEAFLAYFRDVHVDALDVTEQVLDWLKNPLMKNLSEEERKLLESLDLERLREMFEERLREQKKRHQGGNRWIGSGGTSPFGTGGAHPTGLRIGAGGGRSAMQVAGQRRYREYRKDRVLDVRQIDVALRGLRRLGREGAPEELDLDETIEATGKNAGELELVFVPPKRNRLKLILLMDVGGSMDPWTELVERLFTAASRSGRFARFRHFYFHNCVYDSVYRDARFRDPLPIHDLIAESDRDERLVFVGDALMHPAELLNAGGAIYYYEHNRRSGLDRLKELREYYRRAVWLNPEPERYWPGTTIELIAAVFPMFQLTVAGLEEAVRQLTRGGRMPRVPAAAGGR